MMKKWGLAIFAFVLIMNACKDDDDFNEASIEDQNRWDDEAILAYLEDHYFEPQRGKIKKYDTEDTIDDDYPNLFSQGTKLPSGVWVIKKNGFIAEGPIADDHAQDSILISHETMRFTASYDDLAEGQKPYTNNFSTLYTTINSTGTPAWDPYFYYTHISPNMANNGMNLSHYVMEGFVEGIKHFPSTNTDGTETYNFQGAILVPSRAAFARDVVYVGGSASYAFRNTSFIFNFELHKVIDRID